MPTRGWGCCQPLFEAALPLTFLQCRGGTDPAQSHGQQLRGRSCSRALFLGREEDSAGSAHFATSVNDRMWLRFRQFQVQLFSDLFQVMQQNTSLHTRQSQRHTVLSLNWFPSREAKGKRTEREVLPCCALIKVAFKGMFWLCLFPAFSLALLFFVPLSGSGFFST